MYMDITFSDMTEEEMETGTRILENKSCKYEVCSQCPFHDIGNCKILDIINDYDIKLDEIMISI